MVHLPERQDELRRCYDEQAAHFVETRKRPWPEFVYLKEHVEKLIEKKPQATFIEIWCGGGRLYTELAHILPAWTTYTGVDFAPGMIKQAKKAAPWAKRLVKDMIAYLQKQPQESVDCLLGIASVQHIKGKKQRALFFADAYRSLTRWGVMILTNWAYSERFLKKYRKQIATTLPMMLVDHALVRNDVLIPRKDHKDPTQHHTRYYHLFTLYELQQLARQAGFVVRVCSYVAQDGLLSNERKNARNSFLVLQKEIV